MRKLFIVLLSVLAVFGLASCKKDPTTPTETVVPTVQQFQGVTNKEIKVGNTASRTGAYNSIGLPFMQIIEAVFDEYNRGTLVLSDGSTGLINGRTIKFINIDDKSNAADGLAAFEELVYDEKVFALVGHFGTWTVAPTVETIQEVGIPMVHAATGTNQLYFEGTVGNPVMAIQPIYKTDGRVMAARAITTAELATTDKVVVVYTSDDVGNSILAGVDQQLEGYTNVEKVAITAEDAVAGATAALNAKAIIVATNQPAFMEFVSELHGQGGGVKAPIFTSYVNAAASHVDKTEDQVGDLYFNGWNESPAAEKAEFDRIVDASTKLSAAEKAELKISVHSISGYIAATTFIEGLRRVGEAELTWDSFIAAMEDGAIDLPLAGGVDFSGGQRIGTDTMSLWKYNRTSHELDLIDDLKSIPQIMGEEE